MTKHESHPKVNTSWPERNVHVLIWALCIVCALLSLADLFYSNPHPHFGIETSFAFHAWFGFVAFMVIVFLGQLLRVFVSRPEDYYDRERDNDGE